MKITVYAGSSSNAAPPFISLAIKLGQEIAERKHTMIYGGGRTGLMGAAADGALSRNGTVEGIILDIFLEKDAHHKGLSKLSVTDTMRKRKAELDQNGDAFIALPGGYGTFEEITEILSFRKLGFHERPLVLLDCATPEGRSFWQPLKDLFEGAVSAGFEKRERGDFFSITDDPGGAVTACEAQKPDS